jgi:hypothetical protein
MPKSDHAAPYGRSPILGCPTKVSTSILQERQARSGDLASVTGGGCLTEPHLIRRVQLGRRRAGYDLCGKLPQLSSGIPSVAWMYADDVVDALAWTARANTAIDEVFVILHCAACAPPRRGGAGCLDNRKRGATAVQCCYRLSDEFWPARRPATGHMSSEQAGLRPLKDRPCWTVAWCAQSLLPAQMGA